MQLEAENKKRYPNVPLLDANSLAVCTLLHDFCDCRGKHHIKGHGYRSAMMLKELGLHLNDDEFLAIRYHMSLKSHENDSRYEDAHHCHLRSITHNADGKSAKMYKGANAC